MEIQLKIWAVWNQLISNPANLLSRISRFLSLHSADLHGDSSTPLRQAPTLYIQRRFGRSVPDRFYFSQHHIHTFERLLTMSAAIAFSAVRASAPVKVSLVPTVIVLFRQLDDQNKYQWVFWKSPWSSGTRAQSCVLSLAPFRRPLLS